MLSTGGNRQKSLLKVLVLVSAALLFAATASAANPKASGSPPSSTSVESLCGQAKGYLQNYLDGGKTEKRWAYLAIETALKARKADKSSALPHIIMAVVFLEMGEKDKAVDRVKEAMRLDPKNKEAARLANTLKIKSTAPTRTLKAGADKGDTKKYPDGGVYVGSLRDGKRTGYGMFSEPGGGKYVGEWKNDKRDGIGTFTWPDGQKYTGEWEKDERNGHGKYTWPDGSVYVGQFTNGKKDGHGILKLPDKTIYIGEFDMDIAVGHAKKYFSNHNEIYVGEFQNGSPTGHGVQVWPNTHRYVGMWEGGRAVGGLYCWPDGKKTWSHQDPNGTWINRQANQ